MDTPHAAISGSPLQFTRTEAPSRRARSSISARASDGTLAISSTPPGRSGGWRPLSTRACRAVPCGDCGRAKRLRSDRALDAACRPAASGACVDAAHRRSDGTDRNEIAARPCHSPRTAFGPRVPLPSSFRRTGRGRPWQRPASSGRSPCMVLAWSGRPGSGGSWWCCGSRDGRCRMRYTSSWAAFGRPSRAAPDQCGRRQPGICRRRCTSHGKSPPYRGRCCRTGPHWRLCLRGVRERLHHLQGSARERL